MVVLPVSSSLSVLLAGLFVSMNGVLCLMDRKRMLIYFVTCLRTDDNATPRVGR